MTATISETARTETELADRLVGTAALPGASGAPTQWPAEPAFLAWIRRLTKQAVYTWDFEELAARRWIGGDLYGTRALPAAPAFLAATDTRALPPYLVAPFLRRLSLTRDAPTAAELNPEALAAEAGPVTSARCAQRLWGQHAADTPPLPETIVIPHLLHGIWLGPPLPATSTFWTNYATAADRYHGEFDVILWTDISRTEIHHHPHLLAWAVEHHIQLINIHEIFHATAPMTLHTPYTLETTKHLPRGYAAASDHLRIDIINRFGGIYADGDLRFGPGLEHVLERVARSVLALTLNTNQDDQPHPDVVIAPAGHPAIRLWLECARLNYCLSQPAMFGGVPDMALPYVGTRRQEHRYLVPHRSGRVHLFMLHLTHTPDWMLPGIRPTVIPGRAYSWLPAPGAPEAVPQHQDPATVLADLITFLRWQLLTRDGDLYLTAVDPVVRGLPDPDAAWFTLLSAFARLIGDLREVTSVTDRRRNDDGTLSTVRLPPAAEALLDRTADPLTWIGAGYTDTREIWLLDERVTPVTLRAEAP